MTTLPAVDLCYSFTANSGQFVGSLYANPQDTCMYFGQAGYKITGYSAASSNFTLLGYNAKGASDNCLIMPSENYPTPPYLDHNGITFLTSAGTEYNFYYDPVDSMYSIYSSLDSPGHPTDFSVTPCGVMPLGEKTLIAPPPLEMACESGLATQYQFKAEKGAFTGQITIDPDQVCTDPQDSTHTGYFITQLYAQILLPSGAQTLTRQSSDSVERPDYCFFPTANQPHFDYQGIGLIRDPTGSNDNVGNVYQIYYFGTSTFGYSYALGLRGPQNVQPGGTDFEIVANCGSMSSSSTQSYTSISAASSFSSSKSEISTSTSSPSRFTSISSPSTSSTSPGPTSASPTSVSSTSVSSTSISPTDISFTSVSSTSISPTGISFTSVSSTSFSSTVGGSISGSSSIGGSTSGSSTIGGSTSGSSTSISSTSISSTSISSTSISPNSTDFSSTVNHTSSVSPSFSTIISSSSSYKSSSGFTSSFSGGSDSSSNIENSLMTSASIAGYGNSRTGYTRSDGSSSTISGFSQFSTQMGLESAATTAIFPPTKSIADSSSQTLTVIQHNIYSLSSNLSIFYTMKQSSAPIPTMMTSFTGLGEVGAAARQTTNYPTSYVRSNTMSELHLSSTTKREASSVSVTPSSLVDGLRPLQADSRPDQARPSSRSDTDTGNAVRIDPGTLEAPNADASDIVNSQTGPSPGVYANSASSIVTPVNKSSNIEAVPSQTEASAYEPDLEDAEGNTLNPNEVGDVNLSSTDSFGKSFPSTSRSTGAWSTTESTTHDFQTSSIRAPPSTLVLSSLTTSATVSSIFLPTSNFTITPKQVNILTSSAHRITCKAAYVIFPMLLAIMYIL